MSIIKLLIVLFMVIKFTFSSSLIGNLEYPILFVHGFNSSPETWGFDVGDASLQPGGGENSNTESSRFLTSSEESNTVFQIAKKYDPGFSIADANTPGIINNIGLECFNAQNRYAIVPNQWQDFEWGAELYQRITEVLDEYYGSAWQSDMSKKITLICHSQGGIAAKLLFINYTSNSVANPIAHIEKVITVGTPYKGSPWARNNTSHPEPWGFVKDVMTLAQKNANLLYFKVEGSIYENRFGSIDISWDPFNVIRPTFEGLLAASENFNPSSDFIHSISSYDNLAKNPVTGKYQPWVYLTTTESQLLGDINSQARSYLMQWDVSNWWYEPWYQQWIDYEEEYKTLGIPNSLNWLYYISNYYNNINPYFENMSIPELCGNNVGDLNGCNDPVQTFTFWEGTPLEFSVEQDFLNDEEFKACGYYNVCDFDEIPQHPPLIRDGIAAVEEKELLNSTSDLIVPVESQTLYNLYPASVKNKSIFEVNTIGTWHGDQPKRYDIFSNALDIEIKEQSDIAPAINLLLD